MHSSSPTKFNGIEINHGVYTLLIVFNAIWLHLTLTGGCHQIPGPVCVGKGWEDLLRLELPALDWDTFGDSEGVAWG